MHPSPDPGQQETQAAGVTQRSRSPGGQPSQGPGWGIAAPVPPRPRRHPTVPGGAAGETEARAGGGGGPASRRTRHPPIPGRAPRPVLHLRVPRSAQTDGRKEAEWTGGRTAHADHATPARKWACLPVGSGRPCAPSSGRWAGPRPVLQGRATWPYNGSGSGLPVGRDPTGGA